jgi:hypothetical protein
MPALVERSPAFLLRFIGSLGSAARWTSKDRAVNGDAPSSTTG